MGQAFVYRPHGLYAAPFNQKRCAATVHGLRGASSQCRSSGAVREAGHLWCRKHAPSAFENREKAREAKYEAETRAKDLGYEIEAAERRVVETATSFERILQWCLWREPKVMVVGKRLCERVKALEKLRKQQRDAKRASD